MKKSQIFNFFKELLKICLKNHNIRDKIVYNCHKIVQIAKELKFVKNCKKSKYLNKVKSVKLKKKKIVKIVKIAILVKVVKNY